MQRAALALVLCLTPLYGQPHPQRDWTRHPAIQQIDTAGDIYAVGDVHGDYGRLIALLSAAKIISAPPATPESPAWTAGKSVLVFTGDTIDKGPHSLEVLRFLRALQTAAAAKGGRVVAIMGNHEAEFLHDPAEKKVRDFARDLEHAGLAAQDVAACRGDIGQFLCSLPVGARVRDWFFSHAGNTGGRNIPQLLSDFQAGFGEHGFGSQQFVGDNSLLEARIGDEGPGGESWFHPHDSALTSRLSDAQLLAENARALGVAHLVQGHQHQAILFEDGRVRKAGEMFQWRGLLFLIDVGMSEGVGDSQGAVLHIPALPGRGASAICPGGRSVKLWDFKQKLRSGAAVCGPRL